MLAVAVMGWDISLETLIIGALTGLTYAILAAGLVLVYRATKVINFAHGEIGAFGAALLAKLVLDWHWNFFLALVAVLVVGGALGAVIELGVVRRLFRAPRLILLVATIGISQLVFVGQLLLPGIDHVAAYPSPLHLNVQVGTLRLSSEHFMVLFLVPVIIVGLAFFLNRTWYGLAIRASAENADRAELAGMSTRRVSTLVWVVAGMLSTLTAVLINPLRGVIVGAPLQALGPGLLLRALAAALVGRLTSLPLALAGGVAIGVGEAILFVNVSDPGIVDAILFVVVLVLVLTRGRNVDERTSSWSLTPKVKAVPARLRDVWWVRRLGWLSAALGLFVAVALPFSFPSSARTLTFSLVAIYAIIGLSVTVLIGWAGQLSLGQFAFVGLGSMVATMLVNKGISFPVAIGYATVAGVLAAGLVGFPALRVRGPFLSVTTLAFAVASANYLLTLDTFTDGRSTVELPRSTIFGVIDLRSERTYYAMCVVVLVVACAAVARLRASGVGRRIIAVRDNDASAASFGVSPATAKLLAFALSGGLAALAGALLAGLRVTFGPGVFGPQFSLQAVAMVVIGGLGSVSGAVLGAVYVVGLPALFDNNQTVALVTSGIGLLVLLLYIPGGLMQIVYNARDALLARVERRLPQRPVEARETVAVRALPRHDSEWSGAALDAVPFALAASDVTVGFGGRLALDGVTVTAKPGEVVGLIGSNGAGKSTLMNVISGFVPPRSGTVELWGVDVTAQPPHQRAILGMGRVFQDARLFPDLTLRDTVRVALEAHEPSEFVPSLLALPPSRRAERSKSSEADAYIDFLGLGRYADTFLSDLSTGTRRIVELACLLAQGGRLLLLDEPTAGVAQRETEAFGPLIRRIQAELGATVVIIEHDIPLVMSISDRVYCLAAGVEIAEGAPHEVRHDPKVVAAYLGTDERAIERSDAGVAAVAATPNGNGHAHGELLSLTRPELLGRAAAAGVTGRARMTKAQLVASLASSNGVGER